MSDNEINLDAVLFALSNECPLHGGNPSDCQLHLVRKQSILERLSFIATLSEEEKRVMVKCHEKCFLDEHGETLSAMDKD